LPHGKTLRLVIPAEATIVWSSDHWANTNQAETTGVHRLNLWFADFPTAAMPADSVIEFTFFWKATQSWEGRNYSVALSRPQQMTA
jgi:glucoamylase